MNYAVVSVVCQGSDPVRMIGRFGHFMMSSSRLSIHPAKAVALCIHAQPPDLGSKRLHHRRRLRKPAGRRARTHYFNTKNPEPTHTTGQNIVTEKLQKPSIYNPLNPQGAEVGLERLPRRFAPRNDKWRLSRNRLPKRGQITRFLCNEAPAFTALSRPGVRKSG